MKLEQLSKEELMKPYAELYYKPLSPIPDKIINKLEEGPLPPDDVLKFENINLLLEPGYLKDEIGYCIMPDGSGFASMLTPMPHVTGEMLKWWFVWHPQESLRYKIWYPGVHIDISVQDMHKLNDTNLPLQMRYLYNTNYPVEDIGNGIQKLYITFVPPEEFGFDVTRFKTSKVATVICGVVGYSALNVQHTYMVHLARKVQGGIELRSRFWLGYHIKFNSIAQQSFINKIANSSIVKKIIITERVAKSMAYHCAAEYKNLAEILPHLYKKYKK